MKKIVLAVVVGFYTLAISAKENNSWILKNNELNTKSSKVSFVKGTEYAVFNLEMDLLKQLLTDAPKRGSFDKRSQVIVGFPTVSGKVELFKIIEAPILHPDLELKYPGIKSYAGQGIDDPSSTIRFSISNERGFHGMILSGTKGTYFIDPLNDENSDYIIYYNKDLKRNSKFECLLDLDHVALPSLENSEPQSKASNDKKLRKYRLALSCNAEYGNKFAGSGSDSLKKARILAQMNITMTRVNGVYERDLAITMELIPNNDTIIFYGSTSADPWNGEYNNTTQQVMNSYIGSANYDIGHNFNTSGGGNAGCIGCVCQNYNKGSGFTGRNNPTGDAFDIDYVAHEMGHQFGGYHTMNTCSRSGSGQTEVEVASGSSIMGYAGICPSNVQSNSDAYFAYVNIRDISNNVQSGVSSGCAEIIDMDNNPPTADAGDDFTIPVSTAFVLTAEGTDPDNDNLTYCWEQNDPEMAPADGHPQPTWTKGPLFRTRTGTTSPKRYFPRINDVVDNDLTPNWEVIPSVNRELDFSLTVRDNHAGGGQTADDLMRVTVTDEAGPFVVNTANTEVSWIAGTDQLISWDVAGTDVTPVNCSLVNILLSTDGGYTYPHLLIGNTPNDGSETVSVPLNSVTTEGRIKVEAADNIFYDISDAEINILDLEECNLEVPTELTSTNVGTTVATFNWDEVSNAIYDFRYRAFGSESLVTTTIDKNDLKLRGLKPNTLYEGQVRSRCLSGASPYSPSMTFSTMDILPCQDVILTIVFDNYPEEVSWKIFDEENKTINTGSNYETVLADSTIIDTICLQPGCYNFTIYDSNGNGICCSHGWGSYTISDNKGNELITGGSYSDFESSDFCVFPTGINDEENTVGTATQYIYPNPARNLLNLVVTGEIEWVGVFNLQGAKVNIAYNNNQVDVSKLKPGIYFIDVKMNNKRFIDRFIKE